MDYTSMHTIITICVMCLVSRNSAGQEYGNQLEDYLITPDGESEVHGIDASEAVIAIATSARLYLYNLTSPVQLIGGIDLSPAVIDQPGFLELKLLSDSAIGYCDSTVCCYCSVGYNSSCRSLSLNFDNSSSEQMTSVSMAFEYPILTLRLVDSTNRAAILQYNVQEPSATKPLTVNKYAVDLKTQLNQITMKGFVRGGYTYYFGTKIKSSSNNLIDAIGLAIVVTRICNNDRTEHLHTRMDQHLKCSFQVDSLRAVYYDPRSDQIWMIIYTANQNGKELQEMCRIDMKTVDEWFSYNWNFCIRNERNNINICEHGNSTDTLPEHCKIFGRRAFDGTRPCFNNIPNFTTTNCDVDQVSTDIYPFGWLENTKPLSATGLMNYGTYGPITDVVPDLINNNAFISIMYKDNITVNWVTTHGASSTSRIQFRTEKKLFPNMRHNLALSGDSLFMIDMFSVTSHQISCDGFYKTCDSIVEPRGGGYRAPIQCIWCADEDSQMALSLQDPSCRNRIHHSCPANTKRNITAATLRRQHPEMFSSQTTTTQTTTTKTSTNTPGKLITSKSQEIGDEGTDWMMLSVLSGVLIMLVLLFSFIVHEQRKTGQRYSYTNVRPTELGWNSIPLVTSKTSELIDSAQISASSRVNHDYGNLFRNLEDNIKIDISNLRIEEIIGEGKFGIVLRGAYTCPDGDVLQVACKMLRDGELGVRAFFDEGLTMMKFHHEHVIPFIGIALANDSDPIIVTKFMPNGNLLTYLQNNSNIITVDQILEFSMQIAEGMEYLHSKKFIHRDLAARNCMLDFKMQLKIGDFGLARECNNQNMYLSCNYPDMPFAWASVEALEFWTFTLKGDIWSYGIVLWELMTKGEKPYSNYTPSGLLKFLKDGKRLNRPADCPEEFYISIMRPCWDGDMAKRPSFSDLIVQLNEFTGSTRNNRDKVFAH